MDSLKEKEVLINRLTSEIKEYAEAYYTGTAKVSDEYFDMLVDQLKSIDPSNKILHTTGWGFTPSSHKERVVHPYGLKVGSLPKYKSVESVRNHFDGLYLNRISAKLDGLSVVSYYKNGHRTLCLTRGNESEGGLNITEHMDKICPEGKFIEGFTGAIRGEACISNETWNNSEYYKESLADESINQRNIASGLINRDVINEKEAGLLDYVVYKVIASESHQFKTIDEIDDFLNSTGMKVVDYYKGDVSAYLDERILENILKEFRKKYPCDGLVMTDKLVNQENELILYDNEIAFKFQAESKEVVVTNVTYSATRTGRIVPRVWFDPVNLSGAMVKKATGFNAEFIKENKIGPGTVIEICRSGEVIPHILRVIKSCDEGDLPKICPSCGGELVWKGADLVCEAESESQLAYRILTTIAPLNGAGYRIYSGIVESLELSSLKDFNDFIGALKTLNDVGCTLQPMLDRVKNSNILTGYVTYKQIERIFEILLEPVDAVRALVACNIPGISWTVADKIVKDYPEIFKDAYSQLDQDKLYKVEGVGYKTINSLNKFKDRIRSMNSNFELTFSEEEEEVETKFKVAITGKLSVKRSEFEEELRNAGYEPGGISKDTKYLITDNPNSSSSKNKKADEWGVEKITEKEFRTQFMSNN